MTTIDRIVREREVREITGLARSVRALLIKDGRFPAPLRITEHRVGWRLRDIEAWLSSRERATG
ncbi:helix-turn-helix transcriptional regulator [Methylobacterium nigriterrae]|uniref:helix-turn-helix transcriptional regulator n=1 Tax=Methylobacterium nigriterrae TaxID=3127512 RepID=UPI003D66A264